LRHIVAHGTFEQGQKFNIPTASFLYRSDSENTVEPAIASRRSVAGTVNLSS
jgi:hypothetical protein